MPTAREEILARVRAALGSAPTEPRAQSTVQPSARQVQNAGSSRLVDRFVERVTDYRAAVRRASPGELTDVVATICLKHSADRLACPADIPTEWRPRGVKLVPDQPALLPRELDRLDGVLTGCALAVAETGTVVLDHGPRQGRRALTLLPDLHICLVDATQVVADIPEVIPAVTGAVAGGRPITLISGPSATSDIELDRVEGVHGPRRVEVILVGAT